MRVCYRCGLPKTDEEFAMDRFRADGLALICRPCNKEKCREWYKNNTARKLESVRLWKEQHPGQGDPPTKIIRERRKQKEAQRVADEVLEEVLVTRLTTSERDFVNEQAEAVGIRAGEYLRILVRDERARQRREIEIDDENQETGKG